MVNIFQDLRCENIESIMLQFDDCSLKIFREENLIFVRLIHNNQTLVVAAGASVCIALERAESYIGGHAHFSMPTLCLSTKSKIDRLILEYDFSIIMKCSNRSFIVSLNNSDNLSAFTSCSGEPSIGTFLYMMEEHQT